MAGVLAATTAPANQTLALSIAPSNFPAWTRGKTISVTSLTLVAVAWPPGDFVLSPQAPLPTAQVNMTALPGSTEPNMLSGDDRATAEYAARDVELRDQAVDGCGLPLAEPQPIGDVLLLVEYEAS